MHAEIADIDIEEVIKAGPIAGSPGLRKLLWLAFTIGIATFTIALIIGVPLWHLWGAYYVSLVFFMGFSVGSVIITAIFQIVRAKWSPPVRRIAEANVSFLPWAWILLMATWMGREYLFPWARGPMPGKEFWMQDWFVYSRCGVLLAFLFYMLWRFVSMSLRGDLGMLNERVQKGSFDQRTADRWHSAHGFLFRYLTKKWRGLDKEVAILQPKMSWNAPLMIALYGVIYSLFSFEMIMAMDAHWVSNLFGGFMFIGNIYVGWAVLGFLTNTLAKRDPNYNKVLTNQQRWDTGKLTFAFCMLWGYFFFSQFLPQWYGNLPEETQWMILRTRDWNLPWIKLAWIVFPMCFVFPFVTLLSEDVKQSPFTYRIIAVVIFLGVWLEKYLIIMPNLSPEHIPFNWVDIGLFLGFFGLWGLSIQSFLTKVPFIPISHPLSRGSNEW